MSAPITLPSSPFPSPTVPLRTQLQSALSTYSSLTSQLFTHLSSTPSSSTTTTSLPPHLLPQLSSTDAHLAALAEHARQHQARQRRIEDLTHGALEVERGRLERLEGLEKGRRELEGLLGRGREEVKRMESAEKAGIDHTTLLSYASALSKYTSAPLSFDLANPNAPIPHPIIPPFPTEQHLRRGLLNAQGEGMSLELGETEVVGDDRTAPDAGVAAGFERPRARRPEPEVEEAFDFDFLDLNPDMDD